MFPSFSTHKQSFPRNSLKRFIPQMNKLPIPHLKLDEIPSNISQAQQFPPTPRAILRNTNIPKTSPFQQVMLNPSNPNRARASKKIPDMP
jgi:hypothetical protein